jgi:hypothetical protein
MRYLVGTTTVSLLSAGMVSVTSVTFFGRITKRLFQSLNAPL